MQSLYPLLLSNIMGDNKFSGNSNLPFYLLMGAGPSQQLQQWLPLILNNKNKGTSDKLLMLIFMQQSLVGGKSDMNGMFPLMLMNQKDDKTCKINGNTCTCDSSNNDILLYLMMMNGNSFGSGQSDSNNLMFMLFDNDGCKGELSSGDKCSCDKGEVEGGLDSLALLMLMKMVPKSTEKLVQQAPPQRAINIKNVIKNQVIASLGPEYSWMQNAGDDVDLKQMFKFQMYGKMGIPAQLMGVLDQGTPQSEEDKMSLIQWMATSGGNFSVEAMSLMLGLEDAKQFYIHNMIESGKVDPMTGSLLIASQAGESKEKLKELLILAATGQIDPTGFASISRPFVPVNTLPAGTYPGQELYFIHLELLEQDTCALIEPKKRRACYKNMGAGITAEQCEQQPYCCYNPYYGEKVSINGNDPTLVPWCYYNIFFVFHDQYKIRIQEADQFKGPQDCPPLFRYNLILDPFLYYSAVQSKINEEGEKFASYTGKQSADLNSEKLIKLIHYRTDVGFPGITKFHCIAIKGACWDPKAATYPRQYNIPQCFVETKITDGTQELNLYDPQIFKPIVPNQFRSAEGECDANYFHLSTLYYERRACTYTVDMLKYGQEFNPLKPVTRYDCINRLGCCYEENKLVLAKYPWMPRCYQRVKDDLMQSRLFERQLLWNKGKKVCGKTEISNFIGDSRFSNIKSKILEFELADKKTTFVDQNAESSWLYKKAGEIITNMSDDTCMYIQTKTQNMPNTCKDSDREKNDCGFWSVFDLFDKKALKAIYEKYEGIPLALQEMVDLF